MSAVLLTSDKFESSSALGFPTSIGTGGRRANFHNFEGMATFQPRQATPSPRVFSPTFNNFQLRFTQRHVRNLRPDVAGLSKGSVRGSTTFPHFPQHSS
jgi:hypothetical protein